MKRTPIVSWIVLGRPLSSLAPRNSRAAQALLLVVCLALLCQGMIRPVGAADKDVGGAGQANVQVCEAAGGEAEVTQWQYGNGSQYVAVQCNGGYLDGWDCYHSSTTGTWQCSTAIIIPGTKGKRPIGGGPVLDNPDIGDGAAGVGPNTDGRSPVAGSRAAADDATDHGDTPRLNKHGKHHKHGSKHHKHHRR